MPNLAALLTGKVKPRDHDERMALIAICQSMQRTAMAARLFVEVFDTDPEMANRLEARHRYYAACCAARAGCGDGEDMAPLSDEERALWRERARGWLRDDLIALRALLTSASTERRAALPGTLESWLKDRALACVRDDGQLGKLSPAEREAWLAFWRDAKALLAEAKSAISKTPQ
jgi:hypothetical protein